MQWYHSKESSTYHFYTLGDSQLIIENFVYDGLGPDPFFWVGTDGMEPDANGTILPYPYEGTFYDSYDSNAPILDQAFDGSQAGIVLTLPDDLKVSDLKWLSIWCRQFEVNFGDVIISGN